MDEPLFEGRVGGVTIADLQRKDVEAKLKIDLPDRVRHEIDDAAASEVHDGDEVIEHLLSERHALSAENEELRARIAQFEDATRKLDDGLKELVQALSEAQTRADKLTAELTDEQNRHAATHGQLANAHGELAAIRASTIWDVEWQGGRAWVAAESIEMAIAKVKQQNPGVEVRAVKAGGIKLVV